MKATIERATLLRCLSHVQSVVERRNTIPILSNVLIEASEGSLRVMATDLDLQVVENMAAASVDTPGAITVSAHLLFDIARKLPDGSQVSLDAADNRMTVKAGRSRFSLPTLPRDDFPDHRRRRLADQFRTACQNAGRDDRPHALRDFDRRNALLPQRYFPARVGR